MRVIFMGTPDYASKILQRLIDEPDMEVVAVYTQPDKPVGRKMVMTPPDVKVVAEANALKVFQPKRLRNPETIAQLCSIEADFIVVAAYGQILPKAVLDHAPCINLHASILPHYRGASPIQQSLLNGDTQTGVTAMLMDEGLDTGQILSIERVDIAPDEMVASLFERLTALAAEMTPRLLRSFHTITPIPQDDAQATHCKKITKAEGEVTLDDVDTLYNRYRAFTPWPGVYLKSGLKLKKMRPEDQKHYATPGEILKIESDSIVVATRNGAFRLYVVQPPSKREMGSVDYLNGMRLGVADILA